MCNARAYVSVQVRASISSTHACMQRSISPLYVAAEKGSTSCVKVLIEAHADVNKNPEGAGTPLYAACIQGHTEIVKLLLDAGAHTGSTKEVS
jgi:ankyrin repeat protein